jgi:hypothetical protein
LVFLTIEALDVSTGEGFAINLTPEGKVFFHAKNKQGTATYQVELELFKEIVVEESKQKVTDRHVILSISKKSKTESHWPRLTKEKQRLTWLAVDWNKWVDEDEEAEGKGAGDLGPMDDIPDYDGPDEDDEDEDEEEAKAEIGDLEGHGKPATEEPKPEPAAESEKPEEAKAAPTE